MVRASDVNYAPTAFASIIFECRHAYALQERVPMQIYIPRTQNNKNSSWSRIDSTRLGIDSFRWKRDEQENFLSC